MMLNSVDLPAPLGPITARISPASIAIFTLSTATRPPKLRVRPRHSRSGTASLPIFAVAGYHPFGSKTLGQQSPYSIRCEHDECDEDRAENQRPQLGHFGELL